MDAVMHSFKDSMSFDMTKHFAKWGSTMSNWQSNINSMVSFINSRPAQARNYVQSQFNMHSQVSLTFNVSPAGAGRIQVSTIIPGQLPWTGVYFNGNPVTITAIPTRDILLIAGILIMQFPMITTRQRHIIFQILQSP